VWLWWSVSSVFGQLHGRLLQFPHFEECSPGVICEPFTFHILGELQKKTLSQGREGGREGGEPFHDESLACYHHCPWLQRDMRHCSLVIAITNEIALPIYRKVSQIK
jgi:hypothetical protein